MIRNNDHHRRYNRRRAKQNAERQNKVREQILREHSSAFKREGFEGVQKNIKAMTFWGRFLNFFK